jgi:glycosyltransferase involved in cell wall biosynthesis
VTPRVSVCIPTYNGARYVERTVRSALAQSFADIEVVVCDDGSDDGTLAVVAGITDTRVRVHPHSERVGAAANWNRAIGSARAPLVKVLCQDDELYPECLQRQVDAMQRYEHDGVVLVACRRDIVDENGRVIHPRRGWKGAPRVIDGADVAHAAVRAGTNLIGEPSATLIRRDVLERVGGFASDQAYMIDLDAWMRLLEHGRLAYVQDALCTFRVSRNSWSARLAADQARQGRATLRSIRRRYPDAVSDRDVLVGSLRAGALAYARRAVFAVSRVLPERAGSGPSRPGPSRSSSAVP